MKKQRETTVWSVWAGEQGETEAYDLGNGVTSVIWPEMPDLATLPTKEALGELLKKTYPGHKGMPAMKWSLWAFAHLIKSGDYVVMPMKQKRSSLFSIGIVTGDYVYQPRRSYGATHTRPVQWLHSYVPRDVLGSELRKKIAGRRTVTANYADHAAERILAAIAASEAHHLVAGGTRQVDASTKRS